MLPSTNALAPERRSSVAEAETEEEAEAGAGAEAEAETEAEAGAEAGAGAGANESAALAAASAASAASAAVAPARSRAINAQVGKIEKILYARSRIKIGFGIVKLKNEGTNQREKRSRFVPKN